MSEHAAHRAQDAAVREGASPTADPISSGPPVPSPASRPGWVIPAIVAGAVVLVVVAVLGTLAFTRSSSSSNPALGWGHDATREVQLLDLTCPAPLATGTSSTLAGCTFPDGNVAVSISSDATEQGYLVAEIKDNPTSNVQCEIIGKGFLVGAHSAEILDEAVGDINQFANRFGAYTDGTC